MEKEEVIQYMFENSSAQYNLRKAAEEFIELGLALLQQVNKPTKDLTKEIIDEIGDASIRLKVIKKYYSKEDIQSRIDYKIQKYSDYIKEGKYSQF